MVQVSEGVRFHKLAFYPHAKGPLIKRCGEVLVVNQDHAPALTHGLNHDQDGDVTLGCSRLAEERIGAARVEEDLSIVAV